MSNSLKNIAVFFSALVALSLSAKPESYQLPLEKFANMGYSDQHPYNGKGGWTDEGHSNDASAFNYRQTIFSGVEIKLPDPGRSPGRCVVLFRSRTFPGGVEHATFAVPQNLAAKYLYVLHTATHNPEPAEPVGFIETHYRTGERKKIPVRSGIDVANWWSPRKLPHAVPAAIWSNDSCGEVGIYLAKYAIDHGAELAGITFSCANSQAKWVLLGAVLVDEDIPLVQAESRKKIAAGGKWKVLNQTPGAHIRKDSALDLSWLNRKEHIPAGKSGHLIINSNGQFAFENAPETSVRFQSSVNLPMYLGPDLDSRAKIEEFAEQYARAGYNMVRFHFLPSYLLIGGKNGAYDEKKLDAFHYLIHQFKIRGIYVNLDLLCSRIGFHAQMKTARDRQKVFKHDIHFSEKARKNFKDGVRQLLSQVNPYTGLALKDDPVLTMAVAYNEQEFSFLRDTAIPGISDIAMPRWRNFLRERYKTINALKQAWGKDAGQYRTFDSITGNFVRHGIAVSARERDVDRFLTECELELYHWYRKILDEIDFRGCLTNYNMVQDFRYNLIRAEMPFTALNNYHAHPAGRKNNPNSSIASAAAIITKCAATRQTGKPFAITEHAHCFWNRFRYEQGFIMGGYGAFQDFSVLTSHSHPVSLRTENKPITTMITSTDPVIRACEFLTALIFLRGDVKPSPKKIRVQMEPETIFESGLGRNTMNPQEAAFALVAGLSVESKEKAKVFDRNESVLRLYSGNPMTVRHVDGIGYMETRDEESLRFSLDRELKKMKETGFIPRENRTRYYPDRIFESVTQELYLDAKEKYMSIDTPRFQGICSPGGKQAKLSAMEIHRITSDGCLAAVSVDGENALASASRIVLVYITNAFNSNMIFRDDNLAEVMDFGTTPVLWETGKIDVSLNSRHSAAMRCYALDDTGKRVEEIPVERTSGKIRLKIDTAVLKNGPAIYFELTMDKKI